MVAGICLIVSSQVDDRATQVGNIRRRRLIRTLADVLLDRGALGACGAGFFPGSFRRLFVFRIPSNQRLALITRVWFRGVRFTRRDLQTSLTFQVRFLNAGLRKFDALLMVPTYLVRACLCIVRGRD